MNVASLVLIILCFTMLVTVTDISFSEVSSPTTRPMITFDKITYTWTDKVYITILASEYNLYSDTIDEIGNTAQNPIKIFTGNHELDQYKLVETGPNTGVFTGYIILTGFEHDADGRTGTGDDNGYDTNPRTGDGNGTTVGLGPTNGFLENTNDDTITVFFKFSEDETIVKSVPIKWNVGEVQWLGPFYLNKFVMLRIIDPDMNLDSESIDEFEVHVWSTIDTGTSATVTEIRDASGIFEGAIYLNDDYITDGMLSALDSNIIMVRYYDHTLPHPYNTSDVLYVDDTHIVMKEPLKRTSITNFRIINGAEYFIDIKDYSIVSGKPAHVMADIGSTKAYVDEECVFIIQIENANNEVVHLEMSNHLLNIHKEHVTIMWIPDMPGTYTVTVFIWESIDNPVPLSPKKEKTALVIPAAS